MIGKQCNNNTIIHTITISNFELQMASPQIGKFCELFTVGYM